MTVTRKKPRLAFVVTFTLPGAALMLGCCPGKVKEGDECHFYQVGCETFEEGCGSNGFSCRDGKWHEDFTYCNPPAFPPSTVTPPATTGQSSGAPSASAPGQPPASAAGKELIAPSASSPTER